MIDFKRIYILCNLMIFLITSSGLVFSQSDLFENYSIYNFNVEDGLSQSTVFAVYQDSRGFMWFGTRGGGLNRFNGYEFKVYRNKLTDTTSLSNNEIISIFEDSSHQLWVGTRYGGVNRFDNNSDNFIRYENHEGNENSISNNTVNCIFQDSKENLWIGTDDGLNVYRPETNDFEEVKLNGASITEITSIIENSKNNLILGSRKGIVILAEDLSSGTELKYDPEVYSRASGNQWLISLYKDRKNNIWVGTTSGLYLLDYKDKWMLIKNPLKLPVLEKIEIRFVAEDRKGSMWLGSSNGLYKINPGNSEYVLFTYDEFLEHSIRHNSMYSFYEDRDGNIWVGTWGGGASMISYLPGKFRHVFHIPNVNGLSDNFVSSFVEDNKGIWIGTEMGGLNYYNKEEELYQVYKKDGSSGSIHHNHIKCLYRASNGNLWIGSFGGGIDIYDIKSKRFNNFLPGEKVYSILENPVGTYWVGCISGLYKLDEHANRIKKYTQIDSSPGNLKNNFVTFLFNDSRGNLWFGTKGGGLHLYNRAADNFISYQYDKYDLQSINDDYVICIAEDDSSRLWIGTNNGLCVFDYPSGKFKRYNDEINLPDNVIDGIIIDNNKNIWITTNKGLSRYNPATGILRNFDRRDGLQSNEFNRGAYYKSREGELFFGGINGYVSFYPEQVIDNSIIPEVVITDFKLFNASVKPGEKNSPLNKNISETHQITLNYKQSYFSFDFVAINYLIPEKNNYKYKLEGYNKEWVDIGNERKVTFMNLKDGDYIFRVIASNNDEVWNTKGATLKLTILPPPWKTKWAFIIYMVVIAGMILVWYRIIGLRLNQKNAAQNERLEKERNEELNQLKLRFFTNITHEFRTPLSLISAPLDNLISEDVSLERKEYYFKLIKENIRRLKRLVDQLMDFRKAENERLKLKIRAISIKDFMENLSNNFLELSRKKKIEFDLRFIDIDSDKQWFDPEILDKIIFNLLSNAFKFTTEGDRILIEVKIEGDNAVIKVMDTGIGINQTEIPFIFERFYNSEMPEKAYLSGTGIGLTFSKRLTEVHHGDISVDSQPGVKTVFTVKIPIREKNYSENEILHTNQTLLNIEEPEADMSEAELNDAFEDAEDTADQYIMLIVEDNQELSQYLKIQFSSDFKVYCAKTGKEGYSLAREKLPDVIISDIMMPEMDGYELCKKVKNDHLTNHIPFILLTALSSQENKMEGIETGADAYIEKPFEIKYLETVINNLMNQRASIKDKYLVENRSLASISKNKVEEKFLEKMEEVILKNLSDPGFNVVSLAGELNLSRSQLFRKFRSMSGSSPSDYIRIARLKKAAEIILKEGKGVSEVAYEVGFQSPSHFILSFKKFYGKTPKEFAMGK